VAQLVRGAVSEPGSEGAVGDGVLEAAAGAATSAGGSCQTRDCALPRMRRSPSELVESWAVPTRVVALVLPGLAPWAGAR
jgi:hypothetical protein